ncbi:MAG: polymerase [Spirochaetaceae bacterium]|jgi:hypothetical protein|nr:polymerase [Spirochaetaceae bacterium]
MFGLSFIWRGSAALVLLAVCLGSPLGAQAAKCGLTGTLDWERMRIDAELSLDLSATGINFPAGRTQAEEALFSEYFDSVLPLLLSIRLDSSSVIADLIASAGLPISLVDALARGAKRRPPRYSLDFSRISSSYTIDLTDIGSRLAGHREAARMDRLVGPVPVADYTGIIVIADGELPVHGRSVSAGLKPCLFPKIWDTEMNLIYDRSMTRPEWEAGFAMVRYTGVENIFRDNPSGLGDELRRLVGERPLRVIARGVFGMNPTDPVIDRADAVTILSSEANRRLLVEGRVAFVVPSGALEESF